MSFAADKATDLTITLTGFDVDTDDTLSFKVTSLPSVGTLEAGGVIVSVNDIVAGGMLTYVPVDEDACDPSVLRTSFTFTVVDDATQGGSALSSNTATVDLILDCPPNDSCAAGSYGFGGSTCKVCEVSQA